MTITYRTTDLAKWGTGKEAKLTSSEIDINFWEIVQRLVAVETNPLSPNEISNITLTGSQLTIDLADGTQFGPYTLPLAVMHYRGDWLAGTAYSELDIVSVVDQGLFLVLRDHTSDVTFDPDATIVAGPLYHQIFPGSSAGGIDYGNPIVITNESDYSTWNGKYVVQADGGGGISSRSLWVEPDTFYTDVENGWHFVYHAKFHDVFVDPQNQTVHGLEGGIAFQKGIIFELIKVGVDEWIFNVLSDSNFYKKVVNTTFNWNIGVNSVEENVLIRNTSTSGTASQIIIWEGTYRIGASTYFRQTTSTPWIIVPNTGITVNVPVGKTLTTGGVGAEIKLTKVGDTEWDLTEVTGSSSAHTHDAADIVSGVFNDVLLSSNVPLKDTIATISATYTFTADQKFPFGVWKADGKVGINQPIPITLLHIKSNSNSTTSYPITVTNSAENYGVQIGAYGMSNKSFGATTLDYTINIGGDLAIMPDGNVGIGTASPSTALDVIGSIKASVNLMTGSFTIGTLPSPTPSGQIIEVSDAQGSRRLAISDGTYWRGSDGVRVDIFIQSFAVSHTLTFAETNSYLRFTAAATITVPDNATTAFKIGDQFNIRQSSTGQVTIAAAAGVTVNLPFNGTLNLAGQGATATLIKVGIDEWDLMGQVTAAS